MSEIIFVVRGSYLHFTSIRSRFRVVFLSFKTQFLRDSMKKTLFPHNNGVSLEFHIHTYTIYS
jgi:hypothetical protein